MKAAIRVCNLCDCLGSLNLPPDTCDPLRTADSMCWREIREIIVKNTPERVRCRHDCRLPFSSCIVRAPRKRPHLGFCRPDESPVESKKKTSAVAGARRNDTDLVGRVTPSSAGSIISPASPALTRSPARN